VSSSGLQICRASGEMDRGRTGDRTTSAPFPDPVADASANGIADRPLLEPVAFEDLFAAESRRLFGALCLITRDPHEAEDIGQEAFVRVFERWDRVAAMVDPVGYLYRVAMNVFRSRYRRARLASRWLFSGHQTDAIGEVDERDTISRLLGALTPRQRAALVLTTLLDYSSDEAGMILGMPGSSVRVLTTRARATLRDRLQGAK
jgi:RNA polymerase sigma-70 factor (ECF subfamily)